MTSANIKLFTPTARMPTRGTQKSAGLDIHADFFDAEGNPRLLKIGRHTAPIEQIDPDKGIEGYGYRLMPGCRVLIPSGIGMTTSDDIYPHVAPRSGHAIKNGIQILGGIIDADYIGEIGCILYNSDPSEVFEITHGMRVAQLVLTGVSLITPTVVTELASCGRGAGGFGSTGN